MMSDSADTNPSSLAPAAKGKESNGKKISRSPSLLGDRIKALLGVDQDDGGEDDSPPRSRRGLFQSHSSSSSQTPGSSLPPQIPRSFYLGDVDIPRLGGSRSLHCSPYTCHDRPCPRDPSQQCHSVTPESDQRARPPYYVGDTVVQLRRHRSTQGLNAGQCEHGGHGHRHSVHWDNTTSGLETLDFPVRKKTWPPDGPRIHQTSRHCNGQKEDPEKNDCSCSLVNSVVYQKMMTIAGQHASGLHQCYIMHCCCSSPTAGHSGAHAHAHSNGEAGCQCERDHRVGHTLSQQGQPHNRELQPDAADMETSQSSLWTGVSGVPGLGVSIPRSLHHSRPVSSLDEWDRHDKRHRQVGCSGSVSLVSLPRLGSASQRSSSCRSSSRSSVASNHSSSQYSNRSDNQQQHSLRGQHHKSKPLFHKSSNAKRKGNLQLMTRDTCLSSLPVTCECVCTCGDPLPPKPTRRVMFSEDTDSSRDCDCPPRTRDDKARVTLPAFSSDQPLPSPPQDCSGCSSSLQSSDISQAQDSNNHYKSPHEVDGEYSYAYSDSVSPAFLIRVGAGMSNYSDNSGDEPSQSKENIYEEINDKSELQSQQAHGSGKSSNDSQQTKSKFQKALAAVTGRGSEKSFHLSISKGRKKSLIDKAKVDWDCYGPSSKLNKSSSDMIGLVADESSHHKVMSQLKLDVENMLMPPSTPDGDETQDDSGFHSGGHSSNTSSSPKTRRKSIIKTKTAAKRSESHPGRVNRCESIDFKDRQNSDMFRARSRIISEFVTPAAPVSLGHHYGPPSSVYSCGPPLILHPGKKGSVNKSYLSKLVSLPFMNKSSVPSIYGGKNNNHLPPPPTHYEDESGRTFYL